MLKKKPEEIDKSFLFFKDMTNVKDEHLHLLRGHLLIEKKLYELVNLKIKKPDSLILLRHINDYDQINNLIRYKAI